MKKFKQFKLILFIAFTQLRSKLTQTIVAIASVTFGIALFIYIVGYINGVNKFVREITLLEVPDVRIYNELEPTKQSILDKEFTSSFNFVHHTKPKNKLLNIKDGLYIVKELQDDNRIRAVSGSVKTQIYYHIGNANINGTLTGINLEEENALFNLNSKLKHGSFEGLNTIPNSIIMGEKLRERLALSIGDKVNITTDKGTQATAVLIATIKTGIPDIDRDICYTSRKTVQSLLNVPPSYISEIKMKLYDLSIAPELALEFNKKYQQTTSDWQIDNAAIFEGAELQDVIFECIALSILFVAGFGIFNILNMMIYEKMKDIAIIKAMGFSNFDVRSIFMSQSLFIGGVGGTTGIILGFLLCFATSQIPYDSDVFISIDHLPINFSYIYYLNGLIFALLTTQLAGFFPSKKAAKLDPISILRG